MGLTTKDEFTAYRNNFTTIIRPAKQQFYLRLFSAFKTNSKKTRETVNRLTKSYLYICLSGEVEGVGE